LLNLSNNDVTPLFTLLHSVD